VVKIISCSYIPTWVREIWILTESCHCLEKHRQRRQLCWRRGALGQAGAISESNNVAVDGANGYINIDGYKGVTGTGARTVSTWIKTEANTDVPIVAWGM